MFDALRRKVGFLRRDFLSRVLVADGTSKREVDFAEGDVLLGEPLRLVQVCVSMGESATRRRELRALSAAMGTFWCSEAWAVTMDGREDIVVDAGTVHVVPAWEWLLA